MDMNDKDSADTHAAPTETEPDDQVVDDELPEVQIGLSADDKDIDIVDWASDSSFPASDPPPWTPGIG